MRLQLQKSLVSLVVLGSALLLMGASPSGEVQVPSAPVSFPSKVVWTPDGKHIIFSRGFQGIFMVDVAGRSYGPFLKTRRWGRLHRRGMPCLRSRLTARGWPMLRDLRIRHRRQPSWFQRWMGRVPAG